MKLRPFASEAQTPYSSGSQNARAWTERWVKDWIYCPNCGNSHVSQFPANRPVADFFCQTCAEEYELKSQKKSFGAKVLDGAFRTMSERLASDNNPNLLLLNYDLVRFSVTNVFIVPKHFFRAGDHRKTEASRSNSAARRMDWLQYSARARFRRPAKSSLSVTECRSLKNMSCLSGSGHSFFGMKARMRGAG